MSGPSLRFLVFCDFVTVQPGQPFPWLFNPYLTLRLPGIPSNHTLWFAYGIDGVDPLKKHIIKITIKDPSGAKHELPEIKSDKFASAVEANKIREITRGDGTTDLIGAHQLTNYTFMKEGKYEFEVIFDGVPIGISPLYVYQRS